MNNINIIGRLTKDIELSYTSGGMAIGKFSIAVRKNKDQTSFFEVEVIGKLAESLKQYLLKGKQVAVNGELIQDRWTDKEGNNRSKIYILSNGIDLLGGKENSKGNGDPKFQKAVDLVADAFEGEAFQEDIPF